MRSMTPIPLTQQAFRAYGDVIETPGRTAQTINYGQTLSYGDLADIEIVDGIGDAYPRLSIFRSTPVVLPFEIKVMEYHPLGSQAFMPLHKMPFLVVVAESAEELQIERIQVFITNGEQGVNYRPGVWHHYQLSLGQVCDYLVIDRGGDTGNNCIEQQIQGVRIVAD